MPAKSSAVVRESGSQRASSTRGKQRAARPKRRRAKPNPAHDAGVALMAEGFRLALLRGVEQLLAGDGFHRIAGVDEAGRGCLAGPVVAAAVVVDPRRVVPGVDDSKQLGPEERERLAAAIRASALAVGWAAVSAATIDRVNILEATRLAMVEALEEVDGQTDAVLVDAVPLRWRRPCLSLVRGDAWSYSIACASIVAKHERDRLMEEYDREFPGYGFAQHKGYAAVEHRKALAELGPTPIHRLTFRSVLPRLPAATGSPTRA